MKITEIVGSYADQEKSVAPDSSLLQTIANAFTRSGKVKRPLNQQLPDGQPLAGHIPFSSFAASDEDPAADAASNTGTDAAIIPTTQSCARTAVPRLGPPVRYPQKSSSESSSF